MTTNPTDPSPLPSHYLPDGTAARIWRGLECRARGTLIVHGVQALRYLDKCGESLISAITNGARTTRFSGRTSLQIACQCSNGTTEK